MRASYSPRLRSPSRYHPASLVVMLLVLLAVALKFAGLTALAQEPGATPSATPAAGEAAADREDSPAADDSAEDDEELAADEAVLPSDEPPQLPDPVGMERLSKTDRAWLDAKRNRVVVDGRISLRRGVLEMFACKRNTKEHESVVALDAKAFVLHAALLAAGADTGGPVQFDPEYKPPHGTEIQVDVLWLDKEGKRHKVRAQEWVRDVRTKKAMDLPWVFAGSGFWLDEQTGQQHYQAESGDVICVSNFSTAMLDIPAESTNVNSGLFYEAFTERIPPLGTPVRVVLTPVLEKKPEQPARQAPAEGARNPAATPGVSS